MAAIGGTGGGAASAGRIDSRSLCNDWQPVGWVGPHGQPQSAAAAGASMEGGGSWLSMGMRPAIYNAAGCGGLWPVADHGRR